MAQCVAYGFYLHQKLSNMVLGLFPPYVYSAIPWRNSRETSEEEKKIKKRKIIRTPGRKAKEEREKAQSRIPLLLLRENNEKMSLLSGLERRKTRETRRKNEKKGYKWANSKYRGIKFEFFFHFRDFF